MKFLYSTLLIVCATFAFSQVIDVSNPTKLSAKASRFKVIGKNSDGYVVRLYGSEDVIMVYGNDLRLLTTKTIEFKTQDGPLQYILLNKTGAVIFFLTQDKKYSVLMAQPVNSKFIEMGKPLVVDTIFDRRDLVASNFRFKSSPDQNFLFVYYPYFKGGDVERVKMIGLDNGLGKLFNKTLFINRSESELENSKALIDNSGNCYLMFNGKDKDTGRDQFGTYRISKTGESVYYNIALDKTLFGEPYIELDNKNESIVFSGFYNEDKRKTDDVATGFFYGRYEPATGAEVKLQYISFTKEFITELTGREATDNKLKLYTFNVKRAILRNDGGALLIAESLIKESRETATAAGMQAGLSGFRTIDIFQYNDIIAFSIDSVGSISWNSVMRKKQVSEDDNGAYSSFFIMNQKEQLHFIYVDEISYQSDVSEFVLTSDGRAKKSKLGGQEDRDIMLMPKMGRQVSPNEVVIPSYKSGALRIAKITF